MLERINNYIDNKDYKITLYKDKLHIINYRKLISLDDNYVTILFANMKLIIKGNNMLLKKILDDELLISGTINNIEVINE